LLPLATAGALDAAGLLRLLEGLGLEPTQRSVAALMQELAVPRTGGQMGQQQRCVMWGGSCLLLLSPIGQAQVSLHHPAHSARLPVRPAGLVSKQALMQYILGGGRPGAAAAAATGSAAAAHKRRSDTMYRVYSIEQYTLSSALSELASGGLSPGILQGGASLRDLALAQRQLEGVPASGQQKEQQQLQLLQEQEQQERQGGLESASGDSGSTGSSAGLEAASADSTPTSVRLPLPSPFSRDAGDGAPADYQRQNALKLSSPPASTASSGSTGGSFTQRQPQQQRQQLQVPVLVDVQRPEPKPQGLLAWLGLAGRTPLRATHGTAAQFGILLVRSGA
jgi:hypothetical protein